MSGEPSRPNGRARTTLVVTRRSAAPGRYVIALSGELDMQTAPRFRSEVSAMLAEQPPPTQVDVDLSAVTFVDSLGLGTLVVGQRICAQMGVPMSVRDPSPFVARLLEVSGFRDQLVNTAS